MFDLVFCFVFVWLMICLFWFWHQDDSGQLVCFLATQQVFIATSSQFKHGTFGRRSPLSHLVMGQLVLPITLLAPSKGLSRTGACYGTCFSVPSYWGQMRRIVSPTSSIKIPFPGSAISLCFCLCSETGNTTSYFHSQSAELERQIAVISSLAFFAQLQQQLDCLLPKTCFLPSIPAFEDNCYSQ